MADSADARDAADQSWRAFVLVTGLLLVGVVAADDGLFDWLASKLDAVPGAGRRLFFAGLLVVAVTTAFLNLDTAVVFLTPVMIAAARRRDLDEQPFLYGTIFMVNAASLFLPGSNLTNLIVIGHEHVSGSEFARRMFPAAIGAVVATALAVWLLQRPRLGGGTLVATHAPSPGWLGLVATPQPCCGAADACRATTCCMRSTRSSWRRSSASRSHSARSRAPGVPQPS